MDFRIWGEILYDFIFAVIVHECIIFVRFHFTFYSFLLLIFGWLSLHSTHVYLFIIGIKIIAFSFRNFYNHLSFSLFQCFWSRFDALKWKYFRFDINLCKFLDHFYHLLNYILVMKSVFRRLLVHESDFYGHATPINKQYSKNNAYTRTRAHYTTTTISLIEF